MTTKVIFRKFNNSWMQRDGEIIAIFPEQAGDTSPYATCNSYMHVGQHGACAVDIIQDTLPAKPEEYKDLLAELVSIGYDDLKIVRRFSRKDVEARKAQTR